MMTTVDTLDVLNQVCVFHNRSLPVYLQYATPYVTEEMQACADAVKQIGAEHERTMDRIAQYILDENGEVAAGEFPMAFTGYHDLGFDFLAPKVITSQKQLVEQLEICAQALELAPHAQAMVLEALGAAKGHLELLESSLAEAGS